jgi:hypothetical protein
MITTTYTPILPMFTLQIRFENWIMVGHATSA